MRPKRPASLRGQKAGRSWRNSLKVRDSISGAMMCEEQPGDPMTWLSLVTAKFLPPRPQTHGLAVVGLLQRTPFLPLSCLALPVPLWATRGRDLRPVVTAGVTPCARTHFLALQRLSPG